MKGHSSLDVFDFGLLLQALAHSLKVGTLRVVNGPREKYIYLNRDKVQAIYTPRSRYRIGRILYHLRAVELDDLQEAILEQSGSSGSFGDYLVEKGLVTAGDLAAAVEQQMVEELLEVFYWKSVSYEFYGGSPEESVADRTRDLTPIQGSMDASKLLLEVTKTLDDVDKFNRVLPSAKDVYELTKDPDEFLSREYVPEQAATILKLVDGQRSMSEVLREMRMNRFQVMELFYMLRTEEVIRSKNAHELLLLVENRKLDFGPAKRSHIYERIAELGLPGFRFCLQMAEVYEDLKKYDKAAAKYVEHAKEMEAEGRLEVAVIAATRAVSVSPDAPELRHYRAGILTKLDREDDVIGELVEIARIHRESGESDEAERAIVSALELRPQDERLLLARIDVLDALEAKRRAANACLDLARVREEARDLGGAEKALRRALEIAPRSLRMRNALSRLLTITGHTEEAAKVAEESVPFVIERTKRRRERGIRILEVLLSRLEEMDALASPAMIAVADGFIQLGRRERGLAVFTATGEARIAAGQWTEAREAYERAAELAPEDLDLAETLALVHARIGNRERALSRLRSIAGLFFKRGRMDRAEAAYREMLRLNPFSPDALIELARLKAAVGEKKEAAKRLHQIGHLYRTMDNIEDAAEYLDEACRLDPSSTEYVRSLADCLGRVLKTTHSLDAHEALLVMLRARKDHIGLIDVALRVLSVAPDHDLASDALVHAYEALGRKVKAAARKADHTPS